MEHKSSIVPRMSPASAGAAQIFPILKGVLYWDGVLKDIETRSDALSEEIMTD